MDAVDFIKERNRMCDFYKSCKIKGCPAENLSCDSLEETAIQGFKLIRDVEQWSKEHPRKTILQDFLEKYPNAELNDDGVPELCLYWLGYKDMPLCNRIGCVECWNRPLEG